MKLNFEYKNDGEWHKYCANCHAETVERIYKDDKTYQLCSTCGETHERAIVINPSIKWWVGEDNELLHESTGVFIRNTKGKFLFFERVVFPFAFTVPAGHLDVGEDALAAAVREAQEEVGVSVNPKDVKEIANENIVGDSCWQGCDIHQWHAFLVEVSSDIEVGEVNDEGKKAVWLTLEEAKKKELTYPVKYIIEKFGEDLERSV